MEFETDAKKIAKRNIVLYLSIVVILVSLTFKFSYAYFVALVNGNSEATQTVINSGDFVLSFLDTQYINANDLSIIDANDVATQAEKSTFKVRNTSNYNGKYKIDLGVTISDNLKSSDFKWELLVNGTSNNNGTFASVESGTTITLSNGYIDLNANSVDNLELRIWLQDDPTRNQIDLTEGTFTGVVSLSAVTK